MNNIPYFRYVTGSSKFHKMNSKMKIIAFFLLFLTTIFCNNYILLLSLFIYTSLLIIISRIRSFYYLANLLEIMIVLFIGFLVSYLITFDLYKSLIVVVKEVIIILNFIIFTFTTSLSEVSWGFETIFNRLNKYKIPVAKISLKLAMFIKFLSSYIYNKKRIKKSALYRGIGYKTKMGVLKNLFMPTVRLSYNLTKRTSNAMKLRFYGTTKKRTNYHDNKVTKHDKVFIIINSIFLYIVLSARYYRG